MQFDLFIIFIHLQVFRPLKSCFFFFISYRKSESHMSDINNYVLVPWLEMPNCIQQTSLSGLHKYIDMFGFYFHTPCTQTPDGANAVAIGELGEIPGPMVIMGGNCSLQGYDLEGNENFWTVAIFILRFKRSLLIIGDIYTNYAVSWKLCKIPRWPIKT